MNKLANPRKYKDINRWIELGEIGKQIQQLSAHAQCLAHSIMPIKDCCNIDNTAANISKFKSHAEEVMFYEIRKGNLYLLKDNQRYVIYEKRQSEKIIVGFPIINTLSNVFYGGKCLIEDKN